MNDTPDTRESLLRRLPHSCDASAWETFVDIYQPTIYRLGRSYGLQPADAEDLVQEVLTSVEAAICKWLEREQRGRFRAWLFRITRNMTIDFLTRPKYQPWGKGGDVAMRMLIDQAAQADLSSQFDIEYRRELFLRASDHVKSIVTESTWRAFWMTSVENQPIAAVASDLDMTAGSVYIARSRVMKRLRDRIDEFEELRNDEV